MKDMIQRANDHARAQLEQCNHTYTPKLHVSVPVGWLNDPNGFCFFQGRYHLYGQHNPYDSVWDRMHWCHWISTDLLHWTWQGVTLAPDQDYDTVGCFSGTALVEGDRLLIAYTGVHNDEKGEERQVQCLASSSDGFHFTKADHNPIIDASLLPEGASPRDFRDPKLQRVPGGYRLLAANQRKGKGCILAFESATGETWRYQGEYVSDCGSMMECPDQFELDGKSVLIACVMGMEAEGIDPAQNTAPVMAFVGREQSGSLSIEASTVLDYGMDFYAPQTTQTPGGRRVLMAWMFNFSEVSPTHWLGHGWTGEMVMPRELSVRNGKLFQQPVRELEACRGTGIHFSGKTPLWQAQIAQCADVTLRLDGMEGNNVTIRCHESEDEAFLIDYNGQRGELALDRSTCGYPLAAPGRGAGRSRVTTPVAPAEGTLTLRILTDRSSVEVFVNDGEKVLSALCFPKKQGIGWTVTCSREIHMTIDAYALDEGA